MMRAIIPALFALLLAGCGTSKPITNITDAPAITTGNATSENIAQAIQTAIAQRGWVITSNTDGLIEASINVRDKHKAVVTIPYSEKGYSINYKDSTNLGYRGNTIHRNYNKWVINLDREIRTEIAKL